MQLVVPLLFLLCLVFLNFISPAFYKKLIIEDGPVEHATAAVYSIAFIWSLGLTRRQRNLQGEIGVHNLSSFRLLLHPAYFLIGFVGAFGSLFLSWLGVPARLRGRLLPEPRLFMYFLPCCVFYLAAEIVSPFTTIRYMGDLGALYGGNLEIAQGPLALPAYLLDLVRDLVPGWAGMGGQKFTFWRHQEPVELLLSIGILLYVRTRRKEE